jgi:acylphosphatase
VPVRAAPWRGGLRLSRAVVRIHGDVQGVGFRYAAQARARSRSVAGWIRNAGDGSVEAVLEGSEEDVESMIAWCRSGARVDRVDVRWEEPRGEARFDVR